jgi:hypothetical protein
MSNDARITQELSQTENGAFVTWTETAQQTASITQSGAAVASAEHAGIENVAHWSGPVAAGVGSGEGQAGAPATDAVAANEPSVTETVVPTGATIPVSVSAPGRRELSRPWRDRASSRLRGPGRALVSAPAAPSRGRSTTTALAAQATVVAGTCAPFCRQGFGSGAGSGAASAPSGAWYALQPRTEKLAAPGVGRLLEDAPALGQPVDTAPFERPG